MTYPIHYRPAFAFASSSTPSTMAFDYSQVANPCGLAMNGAYLVSLRAQSGGYQTDGVRDSLSAADRFGKRNAESRPALPDLTPFGCSSPREREASVSCLMVTTVRTRVHSMFPVPFTLAIPLRLARRVETNLRSPYVLAHRSFNYSFEPPDYSKRTCSQGHAVPSVVSVRNKTQRAVALPNQYPCYK